MGWSAGSDPAGIVTVSKAPAMRCERYRDDPSSNVSKVRQVEDSDGFVYPEDDEC